MTQDKFKQRLIKQARKAYLGEDPDAETAKAEKLKHQWGKYEAYVNEIGIPVYFGSPENAAAVFATALSEAYCNGDINLERFFEGLNQLLPAVTDLDLGKAVRASLSTPRTKRKGANAKPKTMVLYAELIAYEIKSKQPDLLKSTRSGYSKPKLAELVYDCLLLAGAPQILFKEKKKTVLGWLKNS